MFIRTEVGRYIAQSEIAEIQEPKDKGGKYLAKLRNGNSYSIEEADFEHLTRNHEGYVSAQEGSMAIVCAVWGKLNRIKTETRKVSVVAWNIVAKWSRSFAVPVLAYELGSNEHVGVLHPGGRIENGDRHFESELEFAEWCVEQYIHEIEHGFSQEVVESE